MKILIADDEPHIRELVRLYLSREGYELEFASDGQEALEKAVMLQPDLVVLDLMMPKLDGFEVTKGIRQDSDVPILMLTVRREDAVKVAGFELGADDYLTKPFNPKELVARVKAILRRADGIARSGVEVAVGSLTLNRQTREATLAGTGSSCGPRSSTCSSPWRRTCRRSCRVSSCCHWCGATPSAARRGPSTCISITCASTCATAICRSRRCAAWATR